MGHKNIQHTVRYTELAPDRFKGLPEQMRVDPPFSLSGRQFYRLDQLRIIRIRFRAIDPLRYRPTFIPQVRPNPAPEITAAFAAGTMTGMNAYTFVHWSEDGTSPALRVSLARLSKERACVGSAGSLLFWHRSMP